MRRGLRDRDVLGSSDAATVAAAGSAHDLGSDLADFLRLRLHQIVDGALVFLGELVHGVVALFGVVLGHVAGFFLGVDLLDCVLLR